VGGGQEVEEGATDSGPFPAASCLLRSSPARVRLDSLWDRSSLFLYCIFFLCFVGKGWE